MPGGENLELRTVLINNRNNEATVRDYRSIYLIKLELGTEYL